MKVLLQQFSFEWSHFRISSTDKNIQSLSLQGTKGFTCYVLFLFLQLLYYSAHYPTMFSLFTALGFKNKERDSPFRRIPYYASLVFIELLQDHADNHHGKFVVQFSFKNGLEVSFLPVLMQSQTYGKKGYLVLSVWLNKKQLDEVEHDSENYQGRGLCYLLKPKAEADNTNRGLDNFAICM